MDSKGQHFLHNQEGILLVVVVLTFMKNIQCLVSTHMLTCSQQALGGGCGEKSKLTNIPPRE